MKTLSTVLYAAKLVLDVAVMVMSIITICHIQAARKEEQA